MYNSVTHLYTQLNKDTMKLVYLNTGSLYKHSKSVAYDCNILGCDMCVFAETSLMSVDHNSQCVLCTLICNTYENSCCICFTMLQIISEKTSQTPGVAVCWHSSSLLLSLQLSTPDDQGGKVGNGGSLSLLMSLQLFDS